MRAENRLTFASFRSHQQRDILQATAWPTTQLTKEDTVGSEGRLILRDDAGFGGNPLTEHASKERIETGPLSNRIDPRSQWLLHYASLSNDGFLDEPRPPNDQSKAPVGELRKEETNDSTALLG